MAPGWLSVLSKVPWADVIGNAPKVADGAKRLWSAVAARSTAPPDDAAAAGSAAAPEAASPEAESIVALQTRVAALEGAAADLHQQMLASSELLRDLAEQNGELIKRVEAHRVRVGWLAWAAGAASALALAALGVAIALTR